MPALAPGQTFTNLNEFKEALRQWAIEANFTPHILDSDSHRVRAGCRSGPNCPFRIRANYNAKRGDARVTTVDDVHNCEPFNREGPAHQNIKRAETGKLKFLVEAVPTLMNVTLETSIHEIIDIVAQKYGQKIPTRQAQKVKSSLVTRVKGPCRHCHRMGHTRRHCPQLRASAPGPTDYPNGSNLDASRNDHDQSNDTYGEDGMDDAFGSGMMDATDYDPSQNQFHQQHRPPSNSPYPHSDQTNIDPGLNHGVEPEYAPSPIIPRAVPIQQLAPTVPASLRQAQTNFSHGENVTPQRNTSRHNNQDPRENNYAPNSASTPRTPAEIRGEASRLMQQATHLMHQAASMNSEATRLLASVGEGS